ncbi:amidohydrolase family protein, partial [bacterium]|nr:amidohydrolase family protein [bacterium]
MSAARAIVRAAIAAAVLLAVATAPGTASAATTAVIGGTIHPVSGPVIENGILLFDEDGIVAVGPRAEVDVPPDAVRVDARERHVWPGMINALSHIGLIEVGSVRGTNDLDEHGTMNPNARAEIALNASSLHIPVTRANGVLLAATLPRGGLVAGTAAAIAMDGWSAEEMTRRAPIGLVIYWPAMPSTDDADSIAKWEKDVARLDRMLEETRAYGEARESQVIRDADVRWESLRGVVSGDVPVWIHAKTLRQIHAAMDWTARQGLSMVLLSGDAGGASDAPLCAGELAARGIPVIVQTTRRPAHRSDPYDAAYTEPELLHRAGVRIAFGTWDASNARHLPHEAGRAAAYGLPRAEAERALTLGAAEILGVDDRYGSLAPGKSATFLIVDGDLLETRMRVDPGAIDGREISLESRQTELWKKWSGRTEAREVEAQG